jgi:hypothetical protein
MNLPGRRKSKRDQWLPAVESVRLLDGECRGSGLDPGNRYLVERKRQWPTNGLLVHIGSFDASSSGVLRMYEVRDAAAAFVKKSAQELNKEGLLGNGRAIVIELSPDEPEMFSSTMLATMVPDPAVYRIVSVMSSPGFTFTTLPVCA